MALLAAAAAPAMAAGAGNLGEVVGGSPVSVVKLVLMFALFVIMLLCGNWVAKDVPTHLAKQDLWNGLFAGGALVAVIVALAVPIGPLGLALALALVAVPFVVYVSWRNKQVPPKARAFTPEHIKRSLSRMLRPEGEGEIAADRAVHVAGAAGMHLTEDSQLLYLKINDMPIIIKPQTDAEIAAIARAETFLTLALSRKAGQIYVVPHGQQMLLRFREVGQVREAGKVDKATGDQIVSFFKRLAELDVNEHRKPQAGRFIARLNDRATIITLQTAGSVKGEHVVAKLHSDDLLKMRLADSGMRPEQVARFRQALSAPSGGVILMSAPKHNGRTVSMYAALHELDLFSKNVVSVEEDISIEVPDANQVEVNKATGETLASTVQGVLRGDPDVVMVETIADAETAAMMLTGAAVGKIMIGGLVANDAAEAVESFMKLAGNRQNVAATLLAVTNQRLMRTLCSACREAYRPNPEFLRKANLQASQADVLYREPKQRLVTKKGETILCPICQNEGYVGRIGLYEVVVLDDKARQELTSGRRVGEIRTMLRKQDQQFLQEEGLHKVVEGVTSVSELLRVLKPAS